MEFVPVQCPYCGELVEIELEEDLEGEMVWDCEVCCRPWQLDVKRGISGVHVEVRTDDS